MKYGIRQNTFCLSIALILLLCGLGAVKVSGQTRFVSPGQNSSSNTPTINTTDVFGTQKRFIDNAGQYGDKLNSQEALGKILYGYEGFAMPVLFTTKGFIQLQRKLPEMDEEEKEKKEYKER